MGTSVSDAKARDKIYNHAWLDDTERIHGCTKTHLWILNKAGEITKKYDIRMAYHNHAFEFEKVTVR